MSVKWKPGMFIGKAYRFLKKKIGKKSTSKGHKKRFTKAMQKALAAFGFGEADIRAVREAMDYGDGKMTSIKKNLADVYKFGNKEIRDIIGIVFGKESKAKGYEPAAGSGPGYLKIDESTGGLFHARVRSPKKYARVRYSEEKRPGVRFKYGFPKSGKGSEIQSVVFDKNQGWTLGKVKKYMAAHQGKL